MPDGFGFDGKIVLVTGAARGIGAAITRVFAAAGATVVATDVLEAELAATVKAVGSQARGRRLDVTDASAWGEVVQEITSQHGRLDVLVNNAGVLTFGDLQSTTADQFRRLFEVNVVGVFLGMQAVFPVMKVAGRGAIVNMSSSSGLMGNNAVGAYGATKWAVRGLTRSAALEYGPHGVRVNGVHPYGIDTWMSNPEGAPRDSLNPGYRNVPLQRMGDPSEVANAVLYLASDAASYTSGAELAVDGATCAGQYFYGLPRGAVLTAMLLLENADVHAPAPLGRQCLLVGGGKVLWMGAEKPDLPVAMRAAVETLDLEGRRLIPGLIDGHVHVCGGGGEAGFRTRVPPPGLSRYTGAGVTTVVGLLGTDDIARGPRDLLANVYALREEGLSAWALAGGYHLPPVTLTGSLRADLVFLEPLIGVGEVAISDHRSSQPTLDELLKVAADAHVAGLMTGRAGILHLHLGDGERGLELVRRALEASELPARVFNPTHVNRRRALFDEALELARRGCVVDVTAFPVGVEEDAYSAAEGLERYFASDAPPAHVTVSSDAGGCLPCFDADGRVTGMDVGSSGALLATLRELLARGLPLETALAPFTTNPARLLRLAHKGRIATGSDADLVALDAAGAPHTVIVRGHVHVAAGTQVRRGAFEG